MDTLYELDYSHYDFIERLQRSIVADEEGLERMEKDNVRKGEIERELGISITNERNLGILRSTMYTMRKTVMKYNNVFKQDRLKLLEGEINKDLRYIFPDENFQVHFEVSSERGKDVATLLLGADGVYYGMKAQNGRFVRQLVSLACLFIINRLRGSKFLILDEAVNSGDSESLQVMRPVLERMIDLGMQMIVIEHKHEFYNTIDRKVFYIEKDRKKKKAYIAKEEVYGDPYVQERQE